jgi:hypothetical protein
MFEAAVSGARTDEIEGVEVVIRPALTAAAVDVLQADGFLLGTSANIGYMSGALKHFFDGIYYPCLEATRRRPYGLYVHGNLDTTGAVRAVESITTGLQWRKIRPPVSVTGPPAKADLEACWELGALLAAEIAGPLGRPRCYRPWCLRRRPRGRHLAHSARLACLLVTGLQRVFLLRIWRKVTPASHLIYDPALAFGQVDRISQEICYMFWVG